MYQSTMPAVQSSTRSTNKFARLAIAAMAACLIGVSSPASAAHTASQVKTGGVLSSGKMGEKKKTKKKKAEQMVPGKRAKKMATPKVAEPKMKKKAKKMM